MNDPRASLFDPNAAETAESWRALLAGRAESATAPMRALYGPLLAPAFAIGQLGQSLDGHIATDSGASHYVTGPESLVNLHRLRALADAVLVGWRTAAADDPQLTVRNVDGPNPRRVVLDRDGRLPGALRLFTGPAPGALRVTGPGAPALARVESVVLPLDPDGRIAPAAILEALAARGLRRVLVEGGGSLVSAFVAAGALDRLHVAVAPLITGKGRPGLALPGVADLRGALRPPARTYAMGADVLFDLDLRGAKGGPA
ncbi:MAG: RibD family protein [Marivibrio sp.]|uniref:RibD family protein n=1 Tax=Marivibrio sp. TaxID=2039719 RepID=UPI0032EDD540